MRKPSFVPTADLLETRVVLSSGPKFTLSGAAILTEHALGQTYSQVEKAFNTFARHGENYKRLENNLATARQPHSLEQARRFARDRRIRGCRVAEQHRRGRAQAGDHVDAEYAGRRPRLRRGRGRRRDHRSALSLGCRHQRAPAVRPGGEVTPGAPYRSHGIDEETNWISLAPTAGQRSIARSRSREHFAAVPSFADAQTHENRQSRF